MRTAKETAVVGDQDACATSTLVNLHLGLGDLG
jgi:hypothetical protein